nr:GNAT family N-acetyltransferase [uncultured Microbacterium sp.]
MRRTRLGGKRIVLREWTRSDDDRAFLFDMYRRPEVRRYLGDGKVMVEPAEVDALLDRWQALAEGVLGVRAVTTVGGERLGSVLLKRIPWSAGVAAGRDDDIEIGWHFHPDAWGHGYAAEAASALLSLARAQGIECIVAVINPANSASGALAERIGMRPAGRTRDYYDVECELYVSPVGEY